MENVEEKPVKMIIIVRKDLRNSKGEKPRSGKILAQAAHSALGFVWNNLKGKTISFELSDTQYKWHNTGQTKIVLAANDEKELMEIYELATSVGIDATLIVDEGRTEFSEPTRTCLALGPDCNEKLDVICKNLSLY